MIRRIALVVTAALPLAASAAAPSAGVTDGKTLFGQKCIGCHGADGRSQTPIGKKIAAPDLTAVKGTEEDIAAVVTNGRGKMSAYKDRLTPEQIAAVAKYVKTGLQ